MVTVEQEATRPEARAPARIVGGVGGLVFVASVVAQNLIRAGAMPANDARVGRIIDFYAGHRGSTFALAALFAVGAAGIAAFAGALVARLTDSSVRGAALAGAIGVAGVFAVYSTMLATDLALSGYVNRGAPGHGVVSAMWTLHNAVFGVLLVAIGVALGRAVRGGGNRWRRCRLLEAGRPARRPTPRHCRCRDSRSHRRESPDGGRPDRVPCLARLRRYDRDLHAAQSARAGALRGSLP